MTVDHRTSLSTLDAACLCAERALYVIPVWRAVDGVCQCPRGASCISPGKHPAIDSWQTAASTDLTVLRDWFAPGILAPNLGVVCGPSNVVCIDIDPRNGGEETFAALTAELGALPATLTADSGGGGTHYVFRRPSGELESKLGKGVDLLRDSRQFLVEPSLHPSGVAYRWQPGRAPDEIAIATLPEAWIKRARRSTKRPSSMPIIISNDVRVDRARKYLAKLPAAIQGDNGSTATFNAVACVMFGFDLDPDTTYSIIASDYNQRCDPPWSERELHHKIRSVAERCERERGYLLNADRRVVTSTQQASAATQPLSPTDGPDDWSAELLPKKDGTPKRAYHNAEVFVRLFPEYRRRWALNTMTGEPWFDGAPVRETHIHAVRAHAERRMGFTPPVADIKAAILTAASERAFHPVREYLDSIDWDGQPRLKHVAREFLGAEAPLYAEMVRRWMIGAVARAIRPGCKLDTALMLHGRQGLGKSTFFSILGAPWHSDSAIDISNKDAYQQIHSAWLYEFSELENVVSGRSESRLKAFLTSTHDTFRAPYAAATTNRARSVAICGTTNRQEILTDDTGSRRFWIVPVGLEIDREELARVRDQLWAEARADYEAGEPWWFDRQLEDDREKANIEFETDDAWDDAVESFLATPTVRDVTIGRVLADALRLEVGRQDRAAQMRAAKILKRLGWKRWRLGNRDDRRWVYVRPGTNTELGFQ
jgi:hypothetical protein